ncbi:MAG: hypothetical protein P4M08_02815 [Oligoflexia bacterium]|nr:hypothetical protein [Oligoflexia bacterium]
MNRRYLNSFFILLIIVSGSSILSHAADSVGATNVDEEQPLSAEEMQELAKAKPSPSPSSSPGQSEPSPAHDNSKIDSRNAGDTGIL